MTDYDYASLNKYRSSSDVFVCPIESCRSRRGLFKWCVRTNEIPFQQAFLAFALLILSYLLLNSFEQLSLIEQKL